MRFILEPVVKIQRTLGGGIMVSYCRMFIGYLFG